MKTVIYVVEYQSQYDGGRTIAVFSTRAKAKEYIERKNDFTGWEDKNSTFRDSMDFYYDINEHELDK